MTHETHAFVRCIWCHELMMKLSGIWWCQTKACRDKQREHAVSVTQKSRRGKTDVWLYVPTPKQVDFDACPAKYVLFGGAAGGSKSFGARWGAYRRCLRWPNYRVLILRRTFPELEKTHLREMASDAPKMGTEFIESKRLMRFPMNGSLIECGHMDDADAVNRYLSSEYHLIIADEASTFDPIPLLEVMTRARLMTPDGETGHAWMVSNPGGPAASLLLDFFIDHTPDFDAYPQLKPYYRPEDWVYLPANLDDNPYLDPAYEAALAVLPPWRYEQLRHNNWRIFSGQFFHTFNERRHVADLGTPLDARWFRSMDWGFNQPGCFGWYAVLADGRIYKRADYKFQGMTVSDVAKEVHKRTRALGLDKVSYDVGDPAVWIKTGQNSGHYIGSSIGETFGKYGIHLGKADNDRYNGWMRVHETLRDAPDQMPWLIMHPDCRYTIRSLAQATSAKNNPDDVNTDSDDHALDETRYAVMSRPSPGAKAAPTEYAYGTMGWLKTQVRRPSAWLGQEAAHARR